MKKIIVLGAALCVAMAFTGCKSSESAYKKAYEKAKAQENTTTTPTVQQPSDTYVPEVTPVVEKPVTDTRVVDNTDNAVVRQERLSVVDGAGLKNCSFSVKANAEGLVRQLKSAGYPAQLGYNSDRNMYRVVATTFDSKSEAVQSRDQLRNRYADAWLLYVQ